MSKATEERSDQDLDERRAWLVMAFDDQEQTYSDQPGVRYDYDSNVQNYKQVRPGDLLFVRSRSSLHGVGRIQRIESAQGEKIVARCPVCERRVDLGRRSRAAGSIKCSQGHRFGEPKFVAMPVVKYRALFEGDYFKASKPISSVELKRFCLRKSNQLAIMPVDKEQIVDFVGSWEMPDHLDLLMRWSRRSRKLGQFDGDQIPDLTPEGEDRRKLAMKEIRQRRGQQSFRNALLTRYNYKCAISGCGVAHILEAAHIRPYRGEGDNHIGNGILLRSDIHTLFDLDLIGIEPEQGTVFVSPELMGTEYEAFHGQSLALNGIGLPDRSALRSRWKEFCADAEIIRSCKQEVHMIDIRMQTRVNVLVESVTPITAHLQEGHESK